MVYECSDISHTKKDGIKVSSPFAAGKKTDLYLAIYTKTDFVDSNLPSCLTVASRLIFRDSRDSTSVPRVRFMIDAMSPVCLPYDLLRSMDISARRSTKPGMDLPMLNSEPRHRLVLTPAS